MTSGQLTTTDHRCGQSPPPAAVPVYVKEPGGTGIYNSQARPELQHRDNFTGAVTRIAGCQRCQAPTGCRFSARLRAYTSCAALTAAPYSTGLPVTLASTCSSAARIPMVSR